MEDKPSAGSQPSRIPVSAPKYLRRPRDPLKDGSIFKMGPRLSHSSSSQPYTDTRFGLSPFTAAHIRCLFSPKHIFKLPEVKKLRLESEGPALRSNCATCRQPSSLGISPSADMGVASIPPVSGMTGTPGMAAMQTPGTGQLSRSEIARQIRANFDNLVRASPLPRVSIHP